MCVQTRLEVKQRVSQKVSLPLYLVFVIQNLKQKINVKSIFQISKKTCILFCLTQVQEVMTNCFSPVSLIHAFSNSELISNSNFNQKEFFLNYSSYNNFVTFQSCYPVGALHSFSIKNIFMIKWTSGFLFSCGNLLSFYSVIFS